MAQNGLSELGSQVGIKFGFEQEFMWHPVEAQRLIQWARAKGKAEAVAGIQMNDLVSGDCSVKSVKRGC